MLTLVIDHFSRIYSPKFLECNNTNNCSKGNKEEIPTEQVLHNQQETIKVQSDNFDDIELPDNSMMNFPNINKFVNESIMRKLDRNSSTDRNVFHETISFLESSVNSQSNDEVDEDELDID